MSGSGKFINGTSTLLGPTIHAGTAIDGKLCMDMATASKNATNTTYVMAKYARAIEQLPTNQGGVILSDR
jgi:hypothetical protein